MVNRRLREVSLTWTCSLAGDVDSIAADAGVCTENLNPDVVMVKPAEDRV